MPLVVENGVVTFPDKFIKESRRRKYWRLSYTCYGPDYVRGEDGEQVKILRKHEREDTDDYLRRVETAVPWCFVGPILRRYNDFVHRKPFNADNVVFDDLLKDVNGNGTQMADFMKDRLLDSQIEKVNYILLDTIVDQTDKERIVWRGVDADQVIQAKWFENNLIEAAILLTDRDGRDFIWYVTPTTVQRIDVLIEGNVIRVVNVDEAQEHDWGGTPLVPVEPDFGGVSQAAPIAELQKAITRERSLLDEELWNSTYSLMYVTGASKENVDSAVKFGPKDMLWLPDPSSAMNTIGGDTLQAGSIRQSISDNTLEVNRASGISTDSAEPGSPESGIAKAFRFNDLAANLSALMKAIQRAHRRCETLTAHALGVIDHVPVVYSDDFTMPILQLDLNEVTQGLTAGLPQVLVNKLVNRFAQRNFELSDEEKLILESQLIDTGVLPGLTT